MARVRYFRRVRTAPHVAGIAPPINTVLPVITGDIAGEESSTSNGTWTNSSDFTYQWYLDDVLLEGETENSILTDASWIGQTLTVTVYGGNGAGKVGATSLGVVLTEAPAYTGPLDLVAGMFVGGSQMALLADSGANAIRIRRTSDDTEQTFAANTANKVDASAIATFLNATTGYGRTLFDQSGNGLDYVQATTALQFQWAVLAGNSLPALKGTSEGTVLVPSLRSPFVANAGQTYTFFIVTSLGAGDGQGTYPIFLQGDDDNYIGFFIDVNGGPYVALEYATNAGASYTEFVQAAAPSVTGLHLWSVTIDGSGNVVIYLDGADIGATLNDGSIAAMPEITDGIYLGVPYQSLNPVVSNSYFQEPLVYPSITTMQRQTLEANIASRYGITL